MHEIIARMLAPYKRRKFHLTKPATPAQRMKRRMYYRKNKARIKSKRKLYRIRNKVHNRLRKQMHQVTSLRHHTHVYRPGSAHPRHKVFHSPSMPHAPKHRKPHFTSLPHAKTHTLRHLSTRPKMFRLKHMRPARHA